MCNGERCCLQQNRFDFASKQTDTYDKQDVVKPIGHDMFYTQRRVEPHNILDRRIFQSVINIMGRQGMSTQKQK